MPVGKPPGPPPACEQCGCSELHPCPGGCFWIRPGLCSRCVATSPRNVQLASAIAARKITRAAA